MLSVLTAPIDTRLTTLDRVTRELDISSADGASARVLADLIVRASSLIARECGRPFFGPGTYAETLVGSGSQLLALACVPILSVQEVLQEEEVLPPLDPQDAAGSGWAIEDAEAGALYRPVGWGRGVAALSWGAVAYSSRYILVGGTAWYRYRVTYEAGYVLPNQNPAGADVPVGMGAPTLPGALEQACLVTLKAWWFSRSQDLGIAGKHTGEQRVTYRADDTTRGGLPPAALCLLENYRRLN